MRYKDDKRKKMILNKYELVFQDIANWTSAFG